jgi:hypothetical protein
MHGHMNVKLLCIYYIPLSMYKFFKGTIKFTWIYECNCIT